MVRYVLSKFFRPENVVEYAVSRIKECGGTLDKVIYPKEGEEGIWVTFVKDGMPDVYRISKSPMGPYKIYELPTLTFFHDDEVAKFMMATLRSMPDKSVLEATDSPHFKAICHWLNKEPKALLEEIKEG
jgi:hypothetical protein